MDPHYVRQGIRGGEVGPPVPLGEACQVPSEAFEMRRGEVDAHGTGPVGEHLLIDHGRAEYTRQQGKPCTHMLRRACCARG